VLLTNAVRRVSDMLLGFRKLYYTRQHKFVGLNLQMFPTMPVCILIHMCGCPISGVIRTVTQSWVDACVLDSTLGYTRQGHADEERRHAEGKRGPQGPCLLGKDMQMESEQGPEKQEARDM